VFYVNIRLYKYGHALVKLRKMGWNNKEILLKINMQTESWLFHKLKRLHGVLFL
jgi:hypothetical protein